MNGTTPHVGKKRSRNKEADHNTGPPILDCFISAVSLFFCYILYVPLNYSANSIRINIIRELGISEIAFFLQDIAFYCCYVIKRNEQ